MVKTENNQSILYVNQYFEKNLTTGEETSYYYLGSRRIAFKKGDDLEYTHNNHLTSTSVTTDSTGATVAKVKYFPFGDTRLMTGDLQTDHLFTGQRLDQTGLYYYNARYYDSTIGGFISPDTIVPDWTNPQAFNRYSYCLNNPLKYIDPSGHDGNPWYDPLGIVNGYSNYCDTVGPYVTSMEYVEDVGKYVKDSAVATKDAFVDFGKDTPAGLLATADIVTGGWGNEDSWEAFGRWWVSQPMEDLVDQVGENGSTGDKILVSTLAIVDGASMEASILGTASLVCNHPLK